MNTAVIDKIDKSTESFRDKILRKCSESVEMKEKFFEKYADEIEELSREMAKRFVDGKKLLTMGNGGSLADAVHFTVEFTHPIIEKRAAFPVISLANDTATMTAVGNDIDFSRVFVNQLRLLGQPGDMVAERVWESRKRTFVHQQDGVSINHTTAVCHLGGATLDNEENYLIKKLFTGGLGMVCVSNQARI